MLTAALCFRLQKPPRGLQQLCGAVTAKAVEDCYFYRDARLVSLNEVGGKPSRFGVSSAEFHRSAAMRGAAVANDDVDPRHTTPSGAKTSGARIGVLSQSPNCGVRLWPEQGSRPPAPDPLTGLFLWQNIFGVWPAGGEVTDELRPAVARICGKGHQGSGGAHVLGGAERTLRGRGSPLGGRCLRRTRGDTADPPRATTGATCPQRRSGTEDARADRAGSAGHLPGHRVWEDSLVDPDNRRPVDFQGLPWNWIGEHPKVRVVTAALHACTPRPAATFLTGGHIPPAGTRAGRAARRLVPPR